MPTLEMDRPLTPPDADSSPEAPVTAGRASEDIALRLEAAIVDGRLAPGDRLPSEREMQVRYGTGRGVIREALKMLKQKGLLEVRKGAKGGAFVRELELANVSESLALFLKQHPMLPESVIEFRETLDNAITQLAIARATQAEKDELLAEAERLAMLLRAPSPDLDLTGELDRTLNLKLAQMTRNPLYEWVMNALQQGFGSHDYALYESAEFREKAAANWCDTARAIRDGEPLRALAFSAHHYVLLRQCVQERKERGTSFPAEPND